LRGSKASAIFTPLEALCFHGLRKEGRAAQQHFDVRVARGASQLRDQVGQACQLFHNAYRQAQHIEPFIGHGVQQFVGGGGNFHHHLPALFAEKLRHHHQAQNVLRAGRRGQHDATARAHLLRAAAKGIAQLVRELLHAHQAQGDLAEVHAVEFPLSAQVAGGGRNQVKEQAFGGVALALQIYDPGMANGRVSGQAQMGKGFDLGCARLFQGQRGQRGQAIGSWMGFQETGNDLTFNDCQQRVFARVVGRVTVVRRLIALERRP